MQRRVMAVGLAAGAIAIALAIAVFIATGGSSDEPDRAVTQFSCASMTGDDREMCDWFASASDDAHFIPVQEHFTAPVEIEIPDGLKEVIDGVCDPLDCVGFEAVVNDLRDAQVHVVLTIWTVDGPVPDTIDTALPFRTRMDNRYASALDNRFLRDAALPGEPFLPAGFRIGIRLPGAPSMVKFPGDPADERL